ncbi:PTPRA-like protein, partial [Mya arenaria]
CPDNRFGPDCASTCHCLQGTDDCDPTNGHCASSQCEHGWQGVPTCQTPCKNLTYGSGCLSACHCPLGDTCSPINGLCSGGTCAVGWSGSGCQNELLQLSDPLEVSHVTCDNVTVTWLAWRSGVDRGNVDAVISHYELYSSYRVNNTVASWTLNMKVQPEAGRDNYSVTITALEPDAFYKFRVDIRQMAPGGKEMKEILQGRVMDPVYIPCTVTTTTTTTTAAPPTTTKKPSAFLNDSLTEVKAEVDPGSGNITMTVTWVINDEWENETLNFHLNVTEVKHVGTTCGNFENPRSYESEVTGATMYEFTEALLAWTEYIVTITTRRPGLNLSDPYPVVKTEQTPERVPVVEVRDVNATDIETHGVTLRWPHLSCSERNGALLYYRVLLYRLGNQMIIGINTTATTWTAIENGDLFYIKTVTGLKPYTEYVANVVYVNAAGRGPDMTNLTQFRTNEGNITITLKTPDVTNGVLTSITIEVHLSNETSGKKNVLPATSSVTEYTQTIANLQPNTQYTVKAYVSTLAGQSPASVSKNITTYKSVPPQSTDVASDENFRNESCIKLTWKNDDDDVFRYEVHYEERGIIDSDVMGLNTTDTQALICYLTPGAFYDFTIIAVSKAGPGLQTTATFSVEQPDPPLPKVPEIIKTTSSTITVALDPVVLTSTAYKYGYLLAIRDVTSDVTRTKRATSRSNETCPGVNEIPGNVIRNFSHSEIPTRIIFVIGNESYADGVYENQPLTKDHFYHIYYLITSYFQNVCKYQFVGTINPVKVAPAEVIVTPAPMVVTEESSNTAWIIAVIVIVLLLVIIIVVIVILFCIRRRQSGQKYEQYVNEKEDFNMKVYNRVDDYDPHKYWNTVYSLRESRYIVAGREYLPSEQKHAMNGQVAITNGGPPITFHDEFSSLPHGPQLPHMAAIQHENGPKNRFHHLLPYDQTRVILDVDENCDSDYINANFIKGYKHQRAYIASQSPYDDDTVLDFWRMIYQYEVKVVVMMANIVEDNIVKCTQYWPNSGRVQYGHFLLDHVDTQEYASYVIRTVRVKQRGEKEWQVVYLFEMTYWPEHGVPDDPIPLLEMRHKVNDYQNQSNKPIAVHCGTGVSRSGVFIAVDSLLDQYEAEGRISVFSFVRRMRKERVNMVRTVKQYVFIYETIFEAMHAGNTLTGPDDLKERYHYLTQKNPANHHSYLHGQFRGLVDFTRKLFPTSCTGAFLPANLNKNRFIEIVPPDMYRPVLYTPGGIGRTDFINALFLDSHRKNSHFIITQTPLHTTVIDFWKLVYDHQIHTIVMMEPMMYEDDTCAEYWPEDHMKQYEPFFVETADVYQQENITIRNLKLTSMSHPKDPRHIRQFQFNAWSDSEFIPKSKSMFLDVIDLVNDWQTVNNNDTTPILVHCKDGATHSGLYIALSVLCEKIQSENEVDVYHTVKHLKRRRTQIIDTLDQYRFCYKALWDFINMRLSGGTLTDQMSRTRMDRPYNSLSLESYTSGQEYMPY